MSKGKHNSKSKSKSTRKGCGCSGDKKKGESGEKAVELDSSFSANTEPKVADIKPTEVEPSERSEKLERAEKLKTARLNQLKFEQERIKAEQERAEIAKRLKNPPIIKKSGPTLKRLPVVKTVPDKVTVPSPITDPRTGQVFTFVSVEVPNSKPIMVPMPLFRPEEPKTDVPEPALKIEDAEVKGEKDIEVKDDKKGKNKKGKKSHKQPLKREVDNPETNVNKFKSKINLNGKMLFLGKGSDVESIKLFYRP